MEGIWMIVSQNVATKNFTNIVKQLSITIHKFDLNRCDERTFYITINVSYANNFATCDLIFLVDRDELFGAISLNHLYENVQRFFLLHFNYHLLYTDEMHIAQLATKQPRFSESLRIYAQKFPKHSITLQKAHTWCVSLCYCFHKSSNVINLITRRITLGLAV